MYKYRRIIPIIMIGIMIFGMFTTASAAPSSWAEDFMKSMLMEELASDTLLRADLMQQAVTRAEFAELTVRLYAKAKGMAVTDIPEWNPFADTDNPMVARAYNIGIVSGTGLDDNNRRLFSPNKQVTRQEIAVMLVKELKLLGISTSPSYTTKFADDSAISSWAYDAVAFATETGIISGVGSNKVAPKANATREQAMTIVDKIALKYHYIDNSVMASHFNYSNASRSDGFWVPDPASTQLRAVQTDTGIKYSISHLVDSYTIDIKGQQEDLINILLNSSKINYTTLMVLRSEILNSYDYITKKYNTKKTIYINMNTGSTSSSPIAKPYMTLTVDTEIRLEYIK